MEIEQISGDIYKYTNIRGNIKFTQKLSSNDLAKIIVNNDNPYEFFTMIARPYYNLCDSIIKHCDEVLRNYNNGDVYKNDAVKKLRKECLEIKLFCPNFCPDET